MTTSRSGCAAWCPLARFGRGRNTADGPPMRPTQTVAPAVNGTSELLSASTGTATKADTRAALAAIGSFVMAVPVSSEIVERLRVRCVVDEHTWEELEQFALRNEAADAIQARDAEIERLRALITEWATALEALRVATGHWGQADWNRAYDRWDAIEKALFEEARREQ